MPRTSTRPGTPRWHRRRCRRRAPRRPPEQNPPPLPPRRPGGSAHAAKEIRNKVNSFLPEALEAWLSHSHAPSAFHPLTGQPAPPLAPEARAWAGVAPASPPHPRLPARRSLPGSPRSPLGRSCPMYSSRSPLRSHHENIEHISRSGESESGSSSRSCEPYGDQPDTHQMMALSPSTGLQNCCCPLWVPPTASPSPTSPYRLHLPEPCHSLLPNPNGPSGWRSR
jgi:hypothetical protein